MSTKPKQASKSRRAATEQITKPLRGGARPGSGRPKGSGQFKEPTKPIRVPLGSLPVIKQYLASYTTDHPAYKLVQLKSIGAVSNSQIEGASIVDITPFNSAYTEQPIPLYSSKVAAGIPTPAEDHIEDTLDLNQYLVEHPDSTYMLKVEGESMLDIGIFPNDILVVDRAIEASHNKIVIAAVNGQLTVKRLYNRGGLIKLVPENKNYPTIQLDKESELHIWGVVVGSIRKFHSF